MKMRLILLVSFFLHAVLALGQAQLSTDTSVIVVPHWKKGDVHKVKFNSTTIDKGNSRDIKYVTSFEASFEVKEKDSTGYLLDWVYTKCTLDPNDVTVENQILAGLVNTKLLCKLSLTGRFKELVNAEAVKIAANKVIDRLIMQSQLNPTMNVQYAGAKQLVASRQGLETALLKQVKFYHFSFGNKYRLNIVETNKIKMANAFGGTPFDAVEKIQLTKLDNKNAICEIATTTTVKDESLTTALAAYLKQLPGQAGKAVEDSIGKEKLEFSKGTTQQIEFKKGLVQKGSFTTVVNLGIQNRIVILELSPLE